MTDKLTFLPLGGIGEVTKNMYVYEYENEILIVDCGLGFPDETMMGVDLLIPDVSYLLKNKNKIRGMFLTHAHEDHIGALPYLLPQLGPFPIFGTRLTAAFSNQKLQEFGIRSHKVEIISFDDKVSVGNFLVSFVRVTHSVPDSANLIIRTPVGVFYHASDFKFDKTPADGLLSEIEKIKEAGDGGILCLLSDCLRIEKEGRTPSEKDIEDNFEREIKNCSGKFIVTTYSSNVSRLNQALSVARKSGRRVCFIGRSLHKAKEIAIKLGYIENLHNLEVEGKALRRYKDSELLLLVAGSQGQENSAMVRIANDEDRFVKINSGDIVVFSADPIPGNEVAVNSLIDTLSRKGARVVYSAINDDVHVSGHAAREDIADMVSLTRPRFLIPISGAFRHMVQFRMLAESLGFKKEQVFLLENGQEVLFEKGRAWLGRKIHLKNVYVDQLSGEEVEGFVLRDRQKLAKEGVVTAFIKIDSSSGNLVGKIDFATRGFIYDKAKLLFHLLELDIKKTLNKHRGQVTNLPFMRNLLSEHIEKLLFKKTARRPLVLPIIVEV